MTRSSDMIVVQLMDAAMTIPQIATALGMSRDAADKACWRLKRRGLIVVVGKASTAGRALDVYSAARTQKAA